jgi:hypothetical protein
MSEAKAGTSPTNEHNYNLRIKIEGITKPEIIRSLSVPPSTTFEKLHHAIQIAFNWEHAHLYTFEVFDSPPDYTKARSRRWRAVPRRTLFSIDSPDSDVGAMSACYDDGEVFKSTAKTLRDVFEDDKYKDKFLQYTYDFVDDWEHSIMLIGRAKEPKSTDVIQCLSGEGAPALENSGGSRGWQSLKQNFRCRKAGKYLGQADEACLAWYAEVVENGEVLDLQTLDKEGINKQLALIK